MLRLAGEVADGAMLWLCNPEYIRAVVMPELQAGRERAGKVMEGFEVVAAVPSAVVEEPAAFASMRRDLLTYFGLPFYRAMLERSGFGEDIAGYDEAAARGDGEAMQAAISERFLQALCAIGSPRTSGPAWCDIRRRAPRRRASARSPGRTSRRRCVRQRLGSGDCGCGRAPGA